MTDEYFNPEAVCAYSRVYLLHNTVKTVRCGHCGLLNPGFSTPTRTSRPPTGRIEVIDIEEPAVNPPVDIPPAKRRAVTAAGQPAAQPGLATVIPSMPDFKLGYADMSHLDVHQFSN